MTVKTEDVVRIGKYTCAVGERYRDAQFLEGLGNILSLIESKEASVITSGRNRNVKVIIPCGGRPVELAVKAFSRQFIAKDWIDEKRGSKARRTWIHASHLAARGVGTPAPVGFLDRWENGRLMESYYLAEYQYGVRAFGEELIRLFREDPVCEKFMTLLQCVADAVKAMHEAGFMHNDLGNQNILLRRKDESSWGDVQFIDLNRGAICGPLSLCQRARDISRLHLPSDLLRVFKEMYFSPAVPPAEFQKWEKFHRKMYAIHSGTRWLRHPVRTLVNLGRNRGKKKLILRPTDMWVWDERSCQPINVMRSRDRLRYFGLSRHLEVLVATLGRIVPVLFQYRSLLRKCYRTPVKLAQRVGVGISPNPSNADRALGLLRELGRVSVLVRFYSHETEKEWSFSAHMAKTLHGEGYPVSIGLVQDRKAVLDPERWAFFVSNVLERVGEYVDYAEIGHAINRVKWGIWNLDEHWRLVDAVAAVAEKYPNIKFMGPAVIDFEYPFVLAALENVPDRLPLAALSHHLYVDRRGAPENKQGMFSALEKFALARAIARCSPKCEDRLVVSEVNWPLKGTGVYSPVGAPYESPGPRFNDPSVTEDEYADYMLRYIMMALCSGMVEKVFWWRLVARGFGLVDDTDQANWRKRPAFNMLAYFISLLGDSEFVSRECMDNEAVQLFVFRRPEDDRICVAYSTAGEKDVKLPFGFSHVADAAGGQVPPCPAGPDTVRLSGRPVYVFLK
jgi:hypothetical protein